MLTSVNPQINNSKDLKLKSVFLWTDALILDIQAFTIKLWNHSFGTLCIGK